MVFFWSWRAAVVSSSPERGWNALPPITDELTSVLASHGQHAFALGTVIALAEFRPALGERWPSPPVATAAENRLSFSAANNGQQGKSPGSEAGAELGWDSCHGGHRDDLTIMDTGSLHNKPISEIRWL